MFNCLTGFQTRSVRGLAPADPWWAGSSPSLAASPRPRPGAARGASRTAAGGDTTPASGGATASGRSGNRGNHYCSHVAGVVVSCVVWHVTRDAARMRWQISGYCVSVWAEQFISRPTFINDENRNEWYRNLSVGSKTEIERLPATMRSVNIFLTEQGLKWMFKTILPNIEVWFILTSLLWDVYLYVWQNCFKHNLHHLVAGVSELQWQFKSALFLASAVSRR